MKTILGKKLGMTRVFGEDGSLQSVTVVEAGPCVVLQRKTTEKDGYSAIQVGFADKKGSRTNKAEKGHLKKAGLEDGKRFVAEIKVADDVAFNPGTTISSTVFEKGEEVVVTGTSIGKGFQGTTKRWNFAIGPKTHGSKTHRAPGTLGPGTGKSNVFKGKKLPGHMGNKQVTIAGLKIVDVLAEDNVLLISGSIPGPKEGFVIIKNKESEYDLESITLADSTEEVVEEKVEAPVSEEKKAEEVAEEVKEEAPKAEVKEEPKADKKAEDNKEG